MVSRNVKRNSNIELLRIVSMCLILFGHMIGQNNIIDNQIMNGTSIFWISCECMLGSFTRIGTLIFMCITAWFLSEKRDFTHYSIKIVKTWLHVFICVAGASILCILVFGMTKDNIKSLIQAFFPIFGKSLWYASAYLILLFFVPFINEWMHIIKKRTLTNCVLLLTLLLIVVPSLLPISSFVDMGPHLMNVLFFVYVYIFISFIRMYWIDKIDIRTASIVAIIAFLLKMFVSISSHYLQGGAKKVVDYIGGAIVGDYNTLVSFLCGFAIFMITVKAKPRNSICLNTIAKGTFGVYLIHQTPLLVPHIWRCTDIINSLRNIAAFGALLIIGLLLFILLVAIDLIAQRIVVNPVIRLLTNRKITQRIMEIIDGFYVEIKKLSS